MYEFEHGSGSKGLESSIRQRRGRDSWPFPGRHESHDEIQDETPIFHALTVGGWRERRRPGDTGSGVRRVHRGTVRTTRRTADTVAAFHSDPLAAPVPAQLERSDREIRNEAGDAAMVMLRRRRDTQRTADRAAIAHLLDGAGRHRLGRSA